MTDTNNTPESPETSPAASALPKCPFKWVYGRETYGSDRVVRVELATGMRTVVISGLAGGTGKDVATALMQSYHIGVGRALGEISDYESEGFEAE